MGEPPSFPRKVSERIEGRGKARAHVTSTPRIRGVRGDVDASVHTNVVNRTLVVGGGVVLAVVLAAGAAWYLTVEVPTQRVRDLAAGVCAKVSAEGELPLPGPDGTWQAAALVALAEQRATLVDEQAARLRVADASASLADDVDRAADLVAPLGGYARMLATMLPAYAGDVVTLEELTALSATPEQQEYKAAEGRAYDALEDLSGQTCPPAA